MPSPGTSFGKALAFSCVQASSALSWKQVVFFQEQNKVHRVLFEYI